MGARGEVRTSALSASQSRLCREGAHRRLYMEGVEVSAVRRAESPGCPRGQGVRHCRQKVRSGKRHNPKTSYSFCGFSLRETHGLCDEFVFGVGRGGDIVISTDSSHSSDSLRHTGIKRTRSPRAAGGGAARRAAGGGRAVFSVSYRRGPVIF